MRTTNVFSSILLGAMLLANTGKAQNGYIYTPISTSTVGFSGDGGHASNANFNYIQGVTRDNHGNLYVGDEMNYRIRKVDVLTGIVTTIAGTGTQGYTGDGGPALSADINGSFRSMCVDHNDNLYFYDQDNYVVRKIDLNTGTITTYAGTGNNYDAGNNGLAINASIGAPVQAMSVANNKLLIATNARVRKIDLATDTITLVAGNGFSGYTGDGGLATSATIGYAFGIAGDNMGNIYIPDNAHHVIRKVDGTTGIITTICGNGQPGMAVDNIPAINAQLDQPWDVQFDNNGNLLIADFWNGRLRRIDMATGIINNIAGQAPNSGTYNQCAPALTARFLGQDLCIDLYNNIYYAETNCVKKITSGGPAADISSDSFSVQAYHECNHNQFVARLVTYNSSPYTVKTYYGDGTDATSTFVQRQQLEGASVFDHNYAISGTYPVKHVLYNGANAVDSIEYTFQYSLCRSVSANLFFDQNSDCSFDANSESLLAQASVITVDSNNVTVDTISAMGRFTYHSFGNTGDVYTFNVLNLPLGLQTSCMSGTFTDTIQSGVYTGSHDIATECGTGSAFDLSVNGWFSGTGNSADAHIVLQNTYCNPTNATFTLTHSPKYEYVSAYPAPTTQSGNVLTWSLTPSDFTNFMAYLHVSFQEANSQIVMPGDTVQTTFSITPTTGDIDPTNNYISRIDTVTGPYDPNAVYVLPEGCITAGDELQYTITFENMGNDTAHHIYVMDTLNNNVDMQTLKIVASSHAMNFTKLVSGNYNIVRFDFPSINLPDSSHHDQCHGMVVYTVNSKNTMGLTDVVTNHAGIYFDYMPAVLTNVAETEICQPQFVSGVKAESGVSIYPNPAYNELSIKGDKSLRTCTVLNQAGQVLMQSEVTNGKATLNIKQLPAGIYFVNVKGEKGSEVLKFVKM